MTTVDYLRIVWRGRLIVLGVTGVAVAIAFLMLSFQPKVYAARATILAPKESAPPGLSASLSAILGGGGGGREGGGGGFSMPALFGGGGGGSTNNQDMFAAILRSRTSQREVVAELAKKHGADVGSKLVDLDVNLATKGVIAVTVESTDPTVAADAANEYFQILDRVIDRLAEGAARRQERFYADQLQRAAKEVATAEEAVLTFQAENRVGPIDGPTKAGVEAGGGLRGVIMGLEMQREVMRMRMTEQHPQMREIEKQITELKKQYSKNLFGAPMDLPGDAPGQRRKEFFVSTEKMTPVQFAFLKLYRNLKIQEAFYTGALQGLEQVKYSDGHQARMEPLDPALPPPAPTRPRVRFTLIAAAFAGLLVSLVAVIVLEYVRRLLAEERAARRHGARLERREAEAVLPPPDDRMPPDPFVLSRTRQ